MFIMIIVEELEGLEREVQGMNSKDIALFNAAWSVADPKGTHVIDVRVVAKACVRDCFDSRSLCQLCRSRFSFPTRD